ncbi:MAG: flagellar hook-basal body protein, partial [Gemmatimonadetes bacterium]|nr:flagellar hook-basal body protein [Gemmatimonadota bacterium]
GIDPIQIGLGAQVGSIDTLFSQGNIETTGIPTDLALQGNSFFVVGKGLQKFYTRSGNFQVDANGNLVTPTNGAVVQGRTAINGVFQDGVGDIKLPFGQQTAAKATGTINMSGNLNASSTVFDKGAAAAIDPLDATQRALPQNAGSYLDTSITAYDSLGTKHEVKIAMYKTGQNQWDWKVNPAGLDITGGVTEVAGSHPISFNADGTIDLTTFVAPQISFTPNSGADPVVITVDPSGGKLGATNGLTQFSGANNAVLREQDGYASGSLENFTIDRAGIISGAFSNGTTVPLGQITLADFNNPGGLVRMGDNMYVESGNSGNAVLGYALQGAQAEITSGALEMSNVDLAQEFTSMIIAQRGFQANGRVITTSDQMLEELVSLKR